MVGHGRWWQEGQALVAVGQQHPSSSGVVYKWAGRQLTASITQERGRLQRQQEALLKITSLQRKGNTLLLLVGMQTSTATRENSVESP